MVNFLQSRQWLEFQKSFKRKCWFISKSGIRGGVIKYDLPFKKSYLYCPRGPVMEEKEADMKPFLGEIKKIAKRENAIFFRCDPEIDLELEKIGFEKAPKNYYFSATALPKATAVLNISISEEEILKKMHPKTRYNIRLAEQKGIEIKQSFNTKDLDIFYDLLHKTSQRENIQPHPKEHYQKLLEIFNEDISLFLAFFSARGGSLPAGRRGAAGGQGRPIAAIMILFFGDTATYLHGGSDLAYRNLMAPHLLHWQVICEAKKRGCLKYDFGGISLEPRHPWSGISRFKLSFGAKPIIYQGAYDLIFQPIWYRLYNFAREIRFF